MHSTFTENNIAELFKMVDLDGNGELEMSEIKAMYSEKVQGSKQLKQFEQMFKDFDLDGDGTITKDEFTKVMLEVIKKHSSRHDDGDK